MSKLYLIFIIFLHGCALSPYETEMSCPIDKYQKSCSSMEEIRMREVLSEEIYEF